MTRIVTEAGFAPDDWTEGFTPLEAFDAEPDAPPRGLDLPCDVAPEALEGRLDAIAVIRVDFPVFSDGRGLTLGQHLRRLGFRGRLRARGHVLADQLMMVRRAGFDEVEIPDALAARQPEGDWTRCAQATPAGYLSRLKG